MPMSYWILLVFNINKNNMFLKSDKCNLKIEKNFKHLLQILISKYKSHNDLFHL